MLRLIIIEIIKVSISAQNYETFISCIYKTKVKIILNLVLSTLIKKSYLSIYNRCSLTSNRFLLNEFLISDFFETELNNTITKIKKLTL